MSLLSWTQIQLRHIFSQMCFWDWSPHTDFRVMLTTITLSGNVIEVSVNRPTVPKPLHVACS